MAEEEIPSIEEAVSGAMDKQVSDFTAKEQQAPEKTEEPVRDEPAAEKEEDRGDGRDASGRFLSKDKEKEEPARPLQEEKPEPEQAEEAKQEEAVRPDITRPPKRLAVRSKERWQTVPDWLREDIVAREAEFDKAFIRYDGLGQFARQAEQNGTNIVNAVKDYSAIETGLRQDPTVGLDLICRRMNWNPQALAYAYAQKHGILGQGDGGQAPQQPQPPPIDPEAIVAKAVETFRSEAQEQKIQDDIKAMEASKPRSFPLLKPRMHELAILKPDATLQQLYNEASYEYPEVAQLDSGAANSDRAEKTATVNRSRAAAKATIGSPAHESNAHAKKPGASDTRTLEQVVEDAMRAQEGRM